jgi:hypothetical protein
MAEQAWDQKLTDFLKSAGEELRRTGEELKAETQRLLDEVTDPEMQAKMKHRIQELFQMSRKTAADAAAKVQQAFGGKPKKPVRKKAKAKKPKAKGKRQGGRRR